MGGPDARTSAVSPVTVDLKFMQVSIACIYIHISQVLCIKLYMNNKSDLKNKHSKFEQLH